jgi:hypothetical protein
MSDFFGEHRERFIENKLFLDFMDKVENTFNAVIFKDNIEKIKVYCVDYEDIEKNLDNYYDKLAYCIVIFLKNGTGHLSINRDEYGIYNIKGEHSLEYINNDKWSEIKIFIHSLKRDIIFMPSEKYYIGDNDNIVINKDGITVKKDNIVYDFGYYKIDCTWRLDDLFSLIKHNYYDEDGNIIY